MRSIRETVACVAACAVLAACADNKGASARPDSAGAAVSATDSVVRSGSAASSSTARTVLFLGTSLTAGLGLDADSAYPQQIQRKIDSAGLAYRTVNAGVSGETSAGLLRRLDWVLQNPAAVIVVETGANDGLRGQPVAGTKATIDAILTRIAKERPEAKVALVQMEALPNMGVDYTRAFHSMFPALAAQHGVTLLPFLLNGVAGHAELNQGDGVHPNDVGERIVAGNVWKGLLPLLQKH